MRLKDAILNILMSRSLFIILLFVWTVNIVFSCFVLPPGDDENFFFGTAMGYLYKHQFGNFIIDDVFRSEFQDYIAFPFIQSGFLYCTSLINIPINIFTYKIFHFITILLLLFLTHYFIKLIHISNIRNTLLSRNLFMVFLGISPFAQRFGHYRPEIIGIVFVMIGVVLYRTWQMSEKRPNVVFYCSALSLGMSMSIHPNFTIFSAFLTLVIIVSQAKKRINRHLVFFIIIEAIPLLITLAWYLMNPESAKAFVIVLFHLTDVNKGGLIKFGQFEYLIRNSFMLCDWGSIKIKIAYLVFFLPFLLIFIASIVVLLKKSKEMIMKDSFNITVITFFIGTILMMLVSFQTFNYFVVYSYFIIMFFAITITYNKNISLNVDGRNNFAFAMILSVLIVIVLASTLIHTIKYNFADQKYYFAPKTHKKVIKELKQGDTLFVFGGSQVPTFYDLLDDKYRGNNTRNIYIIAPHVANNDHLKEARLSLMKKIKTLVHEKTVWGVRKSYATFDRTNMELSLSERGIIFLDFKVKRIVYEDKDHIYIRPDTISETVDIEINQPLQLLQTNS